MKLQPVDWKTEIDISREWDNIALSRFEQIISKRDLSFHYILCPSIFRLTSNSDYSNVLDVGCGTGNLTYLLSFKAANIVGVDFSSKSIEIAKKVFGNKDNIKFIHSSIENFAEKNQESEYTLAIANMALMDTPNLEQVLHSVKRLLKNKSHFVFTITHPCYWPFYWKYNNKEWFKYDKEIFIEAEFKISLETNETFTTHIHRPLEMYVNTLNKLGFTIDELIEPMPSEEIEKLYPEPWEYPRFLGVRCTIHK
jgi:ubiquinone/menaquinone biosynthesis C-methylase UbiE